MLFRTYISCLLYSLMATGALITVITKRTHLTSLHLAAFNLHVDCRKVRTRQFHMTHIRRQTVDGVGLSSKPSLSDALSVLALLLLTFYKILFSYY